jgi:flavin-binding protein dodecin
MFRIVEVDGSSAQGYSEAVKDTIDRLLAEGHEISYFQVIEQRGAVREGVFREFQVKLKVAIVEAREAIIT